MVVKCLLMTQSGHWGRWSLLLITIGFLIPVVFIQLYMVKLVDPGRDDASKLVARVIDIRRCDTCGRTR